MAARSARAPKSADWAVFFIGMSFLLVGVLMLVATLVNISRRNTSATSIAQSPVTVASAPSVAPPPASAPSPTTSISNGAPIAPPPAPMTPEPAPPDPANWRSDYRAFIANFRPRQLPGGEWDVDWGLLTDLKFMHDSTIEFFTNRNREWTKEEFEESQKKDREAKARIGQVVWQGKIKRVPNKNGGNVEFDLPPPPKPVEIVFLTDESDPMSWSSLSAGEVVRFSCSFNNFLKDGVVATIRFIARVP